MKSQLYLVHVNQTNGKKRNDPLSPIVQKALTDIKKAFTDAKMLETWELLQPLIDPQTPQQFTGVISGGVCFRSSTNSEPSDKMMTWSFSVMPVFSSTNNAQKSGQT